jgi:hypothetical protein
VEVNLQIIRVLSAKRQESKSIQQKLPYTPHEGTFILRILQILRHVLIQVLRKS